MHVEHRPRIIGRSSSHFTRVAAMFAHELSVPFDFDVVPDLTSLDAVTYGGHPALKVPSLRVRESTLFGTDNICRKLAELAGRAHDPRVVLSEHVAADVSRNAQELVWQAMTAQVQLVVGIVFSELPPDSLFFAKAKCGLEGALTWLERHFEHARDQLPAPRDVSVLEVTLFCLVEHIAFRPTLPLFAFPRLRDFASAFSLRESAKRTVFQFDEVRPTTSLDAT